MRGSVAARIPRALVAAVVSVRANGPRIRSDRGGRASSAGQQSVERHRGGADCAFESDGDGRVSEEEVEVRLAGDRLDGTATEARELVAQHYGKRGGETRVLGAARA